MIRQAALIPAALRSPTRPVASAVKMLVVDGVLMNTPPPCAFISSPPEGIASDGP